MSGRKDNRYNDNDQQKQKQQNPLPQQPQQQEQQSTENALYKFKDRLLKEEVLYERVPVEVEEERESPEPLIQIATSIDANQSETNTFWLEPSYVKLPLPEGYNTGHNVSHAALYEKKIPLSYSPPINSNEVNEKLKDNTIVKSLITGQNSYRDTQFKHSKQSLKGSKVFFERIDNDDSDEENFAKRRLGYQQQKSITYDGKGVLKDLKTILCNENRHQYQTTKHISLDNKSNRHIQNLLKESSSEEEFDKKRCDFQERKHRSLDARITFKLAKILNSSNTDTDDEIDSDGEHKRLINRPNDLTKPIIVDIKDLIVSEEDSDEDFHNKRETFQKQSSTSIATKHNQRFYNMDESNSQTKHDNLRHIVPFVRQISEDGKQKFEVYRLTTNPIFIWTQVLSAFSVSLGSLVVGFSSAYTSPALVSMTDRNVTSFEVTTQSGSWVGGIMPLAALAGAVVGGPLIEYFGRRNTILGTAVPFIVAWFLIAFAVHIAMVLAGRALSGFCVGVASLALPVYLGETIQPEVRGTLGLLPTAFGNIGILLCFVAGTYLDWSQLAFLGGALPIPFLILMFLIPETPRWYVSRNREEKARKALQWLRGRDADIEPELKGLMLSQEEANREAAQSQFVELFKSKNLKPLSISLGLMFFQQFSGINAVIFYTVSIFQDAGSTVDGNIATIIVGAVNFVATFIATVLIDRLGRKVLLYISNTAMIVTLFILGGFFYCKHLEVDITHIGWLPLVSFVVYVVGFSLGFGPIPWLMMGEILPAKVRGSAASVATGFNWTCTFIVTKTYQDMIDSIGGHGAFWLFGSICFCGMFFTIFCVPETQGKSLEDIERKMMGRVRRMSSRANIKPLSFNM